MATQPTHRGQLNPSGLETVKLIGLLLIETGDHAVFMTSAPDAVGEASLDLKLAGGAKTEADETIDDG